MVKLPLRIWRGQTRVFRFTIYDLATDAPVSLAIYDDIEFQVKAELGGADPALISKNLSSGVTRLTQSGDTLGQLEVTCLPEDTAGDPGITPGVLSYDLWGIIGSNRDLLSIPADFTVEAVINDL